MGIPTVRADLVMDTGALGDLLAQHLGFRGTEEFCIQPTHFLPSEIAEAATRIIHGDGQFIVAASALAFVELVHKWGQIVGNRFTPLQLAAFLAEPPDWFSVEPLEDALLEHFANIAGDVTLPNGSVRPIEWIDAVHLATALGRDAAVLVTSDRRLRQLQSILGPSVDSS